MHLQNSCVYLVWRILANKESLTDDVRILVCASDDGEHCDDLQSCVSSMVVGHGLDGILDGLLQPHWVWLQWV